VNINDVTTFNTPFVLGVGWKAEEGKKGEAG
jgi:hypothetical protein